VSDDFLSRWSRRKVAARKGDLAEPAPPAPQSEREPPAERAQSEAESAPPAEPLPPIESLTAESDFSPFMRPEVDAGTRREALKVLLRDPRFNVMDGLDVYIDDYSKPDPLPAEWLGQLNQMKHLGHYIEKVLDEAGEAVAEAPEPMPQAPTELQKAIPEQPVEPDAPDTAELQNPQAGVGESQGPRG
jgi:hypothetical protein